ncbi:hypothetical protein D9758_000438 [Tetrapyrgos nigripes]|uniref:F-box domain-containing protein n=1 Tax=Tetrapyrgos nigripes TaxID=182062 RepID=A0A8H5H1V0_9AGAR|nr:hypothetical protein D9758_000438 [Tetrapyrgos nigripes]
MTSIFQFLDLPPELIIVILDQLDFRLLLICRRVCKFIRELVDETANLVYKIELAASGNEDNGHNTLPPSEKLAALKKHQMAWNNLNWTNETEYPTAANPTTGNLWELFGNVFAQNTQEGKFVFRQLPSGLRNIPEKVWTVQPDEPSGVRDFGMDPAQDLLVLLKAPVRENPNHYIYCKTMSNGTKHPRVLHSGVIVQSQVNNLYEVSYSIQISGDFVGLLCLCAPDFHGGQGLNEFYVFNWKSGALQLNLTGLEMKSFSFMSECHAILTILETDRQLSLLVIDFLRESADRKAHADAEQCYTLCFPALNAHAVFFRFEIRSDPSPGWRPRQDAGVPFHTSTENRLFVVSLVGIGRWGRHFFFIAVPQKILLAHRGAMDAERRKLEWDEWGQETRLLDLCPISTDFLIWQCYVFGSKFVIMEANFDEDMDFELNRSTLLIFDFNQYALKRALSQSASSTSDTEEPNTAVSVPGIDPSLCITTATKLPADVFDAEVITTLPYRLSALVFEPSKAPDAVMCSEDSLITVHVRSSFNSSKDQANTPHSSGIAMTQTQSSASSLSDAANG